MNTSSGRWGCWRLHDYWQPNSTGRWHQPVIYGSTRADSVACLRSASTGFTVAIQQYRQVLHNILPHVPQIVLFMRVGHNIIKLTG